MPSIVNVSIILVGLVSLFFWVRWTLDEWQAMHRQSINAANYNQQANEVHSLRPVERAILRDWALDGWWFSVTAFVRFCLCLLMAAYNGVAVFMMIGLVLKTIFW